MSDKDKKKEAFKVEISVEKGGSGLTEKSQEVIWKEGDIYIVRKTFEHNSEEKGNDQIVDPSEAPAP